MAGNEPIEQAVRVWFTELPGCARGLDYHREERICADVMGCDTYTDIAPGRASLRAEQGSKIWPTIMDFIVRRDQQYCGAVDHLARAACSWGSVGFETGSQPSDWTGRVTAVCERCDDQWLAVHTRFSLYPRPAAA